MRRGLGAIKRLPRWLCLWGPAAMLALVPTMTSFLGNRYQVSVQDLLVPLIVELLTATLITAVYWRLWQRDRPAGYVAVVLATLILASNYDGRISGLETAWQAITPMASLGNGPVFVLVVTAAILGLCWWIGTGLGRLVGRRKWSSRDVSTGIVIMISVTFVLEFATLVRDLAVEWPQFFYRPPKLAAAPAAAKNAAKPDIYYLVMEDYTSNDVLKHQFNFDNADFTNFLQGKGYYVNDSAHNNYPYTTMSVASTMSANYLNNLIAKHGKSTEQTVAPFNETTRNSPVAEHLKSLGYSYTLIGNWYEAFNMARLADNEYQQTGKLSVLGHTFTLNNFSKISLTQSVFSRFVQMNLSLGKFPILTYTNPGDVELVHSELKQLNQLAGAAPGGRFIFADILVPHEPYSFNLDGSLATNPSSDNFGKPVRQKYVDQVQYINNQLKGILTKIDETSHGQAVVVLLSDEGPEPFLLNQDDTNPLDVDGELQASDMRKWSQADLQSKMGTFAAYRVPAADFGANTDTDAADSVNIFRLIFNRYFDEGLPYLPDCYYVYPNGRDKPLSFANITAQLTGQSEDARCQANGTVSP